MKQGHKSKKMIVEIELRDAVKAQELYKDTRFCKTGISQMASNTYCGPDWQIEQFEELLKEHKIGYSII